MLNNFRNIDHAGMSIANILEKSHGKTRRVVLHTPKIVLNLPRVYDKFHLKGGPYRTSWTHRQTSCYFYKKIEYCYRT